MAAKKVKVGSLIKSEVEREVNGQKVKQSLLSIGLGNKGKNADYHQTVEVIVRDNRGKIVAQQIDGFLDVVDPRKEPEDLYKAGIIDEEQFHKMKDNASKLSEKVRYILKMRAS
jgi:hypothetical protein